MTGRPKFAAKSKNRKPEKHSSWIIHQQRTITPKITNQKSSLLMSDTEELFLCGFRLSGTRILHDKVKFCSNDA